MILVNHTGLLLSADDLDGDAGLLLDLLHHLFAILGIPHRGGRASPIGLHPVDLHQLPIGLEQAHHLLHLFLREFARFKHIETQAERHTQEQQLLEATPFGRVLVNSFNQ